MAQALKRESVVYLFGAGASHACVKAVNSPHGILMSDLSDELIKRLRQLVDSEYKGQHKLDALVNEVIDDATDFEHIITFLDDCSSGLHKMFAEQMRSMFEVVLKERLKMIESEQGGVPDKLYYALLDMHQVPNLREDLRGFLTLNYDGYLEHAIGRYPGHTLDAGAELGLPGSKSATRVLKLHGSFGWSDCWPISIAGADNPLWIPPGVQKAKQRYPFNLLWGLARELLDCDVLRIVGCRLGANDWDLVSLLFATRHANAEKGPYRIEIIDTPRNAIRLKDECPYLGVQSLFDVEPIGSQLIGELTGKEPRTYTSLNEKERDDLISVLPSSENWFRLWLKHKAEATYRELGSVTTKQGAFESLLEEY